MSRRRTVSKTRRWLELLLLFAGLTGVGVWVWSHVRMSLYEKQANQTLDHTIKSQPAQPPSVAVAPAAPPSTPPPPKNGALLGRLVIPRIKVRAVVREGADHDTLDVALGHIPGTALPGQAGNIGVAGHRDTLFRGLRHIAKNDVIQFQTPAGSYSYRVESTGIVTPKDVGVLDPGPQPEMTLVTCYPFNYVGSAPDRFIVKARLETPAVPPPAPVTTPARVDPPPASTPSPAPPEPPRRVVTRAPKPYPTTRRVHFRVNESHSTELVPGILFGVSKADAARNRASGWLWVGRARRTIWLRNRTTHQPLLFHGYDDSKQSELVITGVSRNAVTGYLLLYNDTRARSRVLHSQ